MRGIILDRVGLYVHIPFCRAKCAYCDFDSYPGLDRLFGPYVQALIREMGQAGPALVKTIYLGGGTPTVLPVSHLEQILSAANALFSVAPDAEVSLEANPGTVDPETLTGLRSLGVTRLSLGVQSLEGAELRLLGRIHTAGDAVDTYRQARLAGFDNVNLDLIYGLPRQGIDRWRVTLERALSLSPDHLSLYALSVEQGTPLAAAIARGDLPDPDPDLAADMYELAEELLEAAGFLHYEVSNWAARPDRQCRHNLVYWRNEPYLGLGAGAHSWVSGRRRANVAAPIDYVERLLKGRSPVAMEEAIGPELEMGEMMMMGLRLLEEGVEWQRFRRRFDLDVRERFAQELDDLKQLGLIETDSERVRITRRGHLLGNQVFARFLPDS